MTSLISGPKESRGSPEMLGIPPASDTTSGREATENNDRTSEAVIPWVRVAYLST